MKRKPESIHVIIFLTPLFCGQMFGAHNISDHDATMKQIEQAREAVDARRKEAALVFTSAAALEGCLLIKKDALPAPLVKGLGTIAAACAVRSLYRLGTAHYHLDAHIKKENAREAEALRRHAFRSTDF